MTALAILFGYSILMNGSTFAAIYGRQAQRLDLSGSQWINHAPWVALAAYAAAVFMLRRQKNTARRWIGFAAATVAAHFIICYPLMLLDHGSVGIRLADSLSPASRESFATKYLVKSVHYRSSSEGNCVRVRREDYSEEMATFLKGLVRQQAESGDPAP